MGRMELGGSVPLNTKLEGLPELKATLGAIALCLKLFAIVAP